MNPRLPVRLVLPALCLLLAVLSLGGCKPDAQGEGKPAGKSFAAAGNAGLGPLLEDPRVGDLWAAELSHFSDREFTVQDEAYERAYGLMKVIEVAPERIMLITEDGAWPTKQDAFEDLRGDLADIEWDAHEEITIERAELSALAGEGRILKARRLEDR